MRDVCSDLLPDNDDDALSTSTPFSALVAQLSGECSQVNAIDDVDVRAGSQRKRKHLKQQKQVVVEQVQEEDVVVEEEAEQVENTADFALDDDVVHSEHINAQTNDDDDDDNVDTAVQDDLSAADPFQRQFARANVDVPENEDASRNASFNTLCSLPNGAVVSSNSETQLRLPSSTATFATLLHLKGKLASATADEPIDDTQVGGETGGAVYNAFSIV
jgi:hypothetical protein